MIALGIDTSNYACSAALFDSGAHALLAAEKRLLPVREGALGLRQSDAVFAQVRLLPEVLRALFEKAGTLPGHIGAVGVSARPRPVEGSYMPCFLAGRAAAASAALSLGVPLVETTHQQGHVMAALYGTGFDREQDKRFFAFHVSGGTTDALECRLSGRRLAVSQRATSLDLFAGQAVDRVGAMLGLAFPAGPEMSRLAASSSARSFLKPVLKEGGCCLSGLENKCRKLLEQGAAPKDVARYCLLSVGETVAAMAGRLRAGQEEKDLIFAGGVLSSEVIRAQLGARFQNGYFCEPAWLSADNAVGVALLACRELEY